VDGRVFGGSMVAAADVGMVEVCAGSSRELGVYVGDEQAVEEYIAGGAGGAGAAGVVDVAEDDVGDAAWGDVHVQDAYDCRRRAWGQSESPLGCLALTASKARSKHWSASPIA
jgi:hypothetical protein